MTLNIFLVFTAGILSIFSPCIFPLIPSYFAYLTGIPVKNLSTHKRTLIIHAIFFTLGFTIIFLVMGAVLGSAGKLLLQYKRTIEIIGGLLILLFAIKTSGLIDSVFHRGFLEKSAYFHLPKNVTKNLKHFSHLKSLLTGMIFAFGWSPCYGPILGSILTLAISETDFYKGLWYFFDYSLGMALSFIILAFFASKLSMIVHGTNKARKILKIVTALLLLFLSLNMLFGGIANIANGLNSLYTELDINKIF